MHKRWLIMVTILQVCLSLSVATIFLVSCAGTPDSRPVSPTPGASPLPSGPVRGPDEFLGAGQGANLQLALNAAKASALKSAVISVIGKDGEAKRQAALSRAVYNPAMIDGFVVPDSLKRLKAANTGSVEQPVWQVEISLSINRSRLDQALADLDRPAPSATPSPSPSPAAARKPVEPIPAGPTEAQKAFLRSYVDKLTYLVYFNDKNVAGDQFPLQSAVAMANSWLVSQGNDVANPSQIEKLKKDRQMLQEELSGQQASVIQWIAQGLNADMYLEIDARLARESRSSNFYAQATVSIQMYETSTGQLLGSTPAVAGPQRMSSIDQTDADAKSLQDGVYNLMPRVLEQSRALLSRQVANGIKYQLVIKGANDPDLIADFRSMLRRQANVADVVTRSESGEEVVMDIFMYGRIDDLSDAIRTVRSASTGLEKMRQIQKRGKTLTYESGL